MQDLSFINQYNNAVPSFANLSGVERYASSVLSLKAGQIFEGTVNSVSDGQVIIGLGSGATINARLDAGISLLEGSSLFFQVKSNEGGLIQIRPVPQSMISNPTLLNALDAAGVGTNEKSLGMVNAMMENQLPVDAKSVSSMNRLILSNPDIAPSTIVSMSRFNLPVTPQNAAMFENYVADKAKIMDSVNKLTEALPAGIEEAVKTGSVSKDEASLFLNRVMGLFQGEEPFLKGESLTTGQPVQTKQADWFGQSLQQQLAGPPEEILQPEQTLNPEQAMQKSQPEQPGEAAQSGQTVNQEEPQTGRAAITSVEETTSSTVNVPVEKSLPDDILNKVFSPDDLSSREVYSKLIASVIDKEWSLFPEEIARPEEIGKLYERILRQTKELESLLNDINLPEKARDSVKSAISEIRSNVSFMNEVNNFYSFVQIPLKMNSGLTNSELYVYQRNKGGNADKEELTAFLHFDLASLGPTDISIKLLNKDVTCNWYLKDDRSLGLIEANIDRLEAKLREMGYNCSFGFEAEEKAFNFRDDFLSMASDRVNGQSKPLVHRYSFDVRA